MSKLLKIDKEYSQWIQELKDRYRRAQIKAATCVNKEMLRFYWSVGRDIVARGAENRYGSKFYENLSMDLRNVLPESKGFSPVNLFYMKRFYDFYISEIANLPQAVEDSNQSNLPQHVEDFGTARCQRIIPDIIFSVPWGHHRVIIDKYYKKKELDAAIFYLRKTVEDGWSRDVLSAFIDSGLHLREGKALTSFSRLLPVPDSDLAQQITRDPYIFDFTEMTEPYKERELKQALMRNISRFLLELGSGFAYVGEEYRLKIGHTEKFIDLLFYNIKLHAYCVIEVKTGTFDSGDIGQLGTYMTAVNHLVKTDQDNPTIHRSAYMQGQGQYSCPICA